MDVRKSGDISDSLQHSPVAFLYTAVCVIVRQKSLQCFPVLHEALRLFYQFFSLRKSEPVVFLVFETHSCFCLVLTDEIWSFILKACAASIDTLP